jgi:4-diphosphocytidyl-2-C-methyl-D-erythritol kinase
MLSGIGERIAPLSRGSLPAMPAVLVNPRVPLRTDAVFRTLTAPAAAPNGYVSPVPNKFRDIADVLDFMRARGNDLEHPATTLLPLIHKIKTILANLPGCRLAAMSGSGPTCFGIFGNEDEAARAATLVQAAEREWWVAATLLAGS